jgi:hypothetical protein
METRELRITLLKQMDEAIHNTGDELLIMPWLSCGVPDGATQSDFEDIADDDELWTDCCKLVGILLGGDLHD